MLRMLGKTNIERTTNRPTVSWPAWNRPITGKTASFWHAAIVLLLCCAAAFAQEITVLKGSSVRIPVPEGLRKLAVGNPMLIDAKPTEDGLGVVVNGLNQGASELRVERLQGPDVSYKIIVRADLQAMLEQIKELLSEVEGLEVKTVGDKIVLKGNIVTRSGYDRVSQVATAYSGVVLNMSKFDRREMNQYVEEAIVRDIGTDSVKVRVMEDTVILEGVVYSEAEVARAIEMAQLRMPHVRSLLRVQEVMIETDVQFVQVATDSQNSYGHNVLKTLEIKGQGNFNGGGTGKPSLNYGVNANATVKINALLGNGNAKILAEPHLSTKSGGEGSFHSGGETFFQVSGNVGGNLEKVSFGVILKVKPTMQGQDRILNEITIEVSVPAAKSAGAFSLDKFETKSTMVCKVGESIVLSGLIQTLANRFKERTPGLGEIPLLNLFFSEKNSAREDKELVVLITPVPVFPQANSAPPISDRTKPVLERELGAKSYSIPAPSYTVPPPTQSSQPLPQQQSKPNTSFPAPVSDATRSLLQTKLNEAMASK